MKHEIHFFSFLLIIALLGLLTGCPPPTIVGADGFEIPSEPYVSPFPSPFNIPYVNSVTGMNAGCIPTQAGFVAFSGATVTLGPSTYINGDAVLFKNVSLTVSSPSKILGTLYSDPSDTLSLPPAGALTQTGATELSAEQGILDFSTSQSNLSATQTFTKISASQTIAGNGALNVIEIPQGIALGGAQVLTLQGTASDVFVINVRGGISLSGGAQIALSEGVQIENVLFNNPGNGNGVKISGKSKFLGTILAPLRGVAIEGGASVTGAVYAGGTISLNAYASLGRQVAFCSSKPDAD